MVLNTLFQVPVSFCDIFVYLTDNITGQQYSTTKARSDLNLTQEISFTVTDGIPPFDSHYNTRVSLSNRSKEQLADNKISLSKST